VLQNEIDMTAPRAGLIGEQGRPKFPHTPRPGRLPKQSKVLVIVDHRVFRQVYGTGQRFREPLGLVTHGTPPVTQHIQRGFVIFLQNTTKENKFFRLTVGWIATIYATVVTLQSFWGWYVWLAGSDKYMSTLRQYVVVHGLRLRFRAFWGDVIICALLCVAFLIMWHMHGVINDLGHKLADVRRLNQSY